MTEAEVARIFDGLALPHEVSPVVEVSLVLGHNGAPRGYGFVELASTVQAKRAQALMDGRAVSYDGRMPTTLVVREATPSKSRQPRQLAEPLRSLVQRRVLQHLGSRWSRGSRGSRGSRVEGRPGWMIGLDDWG